jgi:AraC-like DNA-binding protein
MLSPRMNQEGGLTSDGGSARSLRFSATDWPEKDRLARLHDVYGGTLFQCDIEPIDGELTEFNASAQALPGLSILSLASSGLRICRSKAQVDPEHLFLNINLAGTREVTQAGREVTLGEGEAMLVAGESGVAMKIAPGRRLTLKMPVNAIELLAPDFGDRLLRPIQRDTQALRLLVNYLGTLSNADFLAEPDVQRVVAAHVHDLAALALGATRDASEIARARGARAARFKTITADIAANLDGDVSITAIAQRHHLKPRSIQMVFEAEGTTFTDFVLDQRLARARRMLSDPRLAGQKISTVAFDVGFGDLSYFNRVFRRRFGATPSELRAENSREAKSSP